MTEPSPTIERIVIYVKDSEGKTFQVYIPKTEEKDFAGKLLLDGYLKKLVKTNVEIIE